VSTGGPGPGGGAPVVEQWDGCAPVPPPIAEAIFGERLPLAVRFADWLAGAGVQRGLIGPHEAPRLWDRHLVNCAAAAALIAPGSFVVDVGSGAGLPGVALAIARPDLRVWLVESMARRTAFLEVVVADLGLRAEVRRARAEELKKPRLQADVVTARAVAPVDRLAALAAPLLRLGGSLLAIKGNAVGIEVAAGWPSLRRLAMADGATLFAIAASRTPTGQRVTGPLLAEPAVCWLPGVDVDVTARWQADGSPDRTPELHDEGRDGRRDPARDAEPLSSVLRLERGAHGLPRRRETGLG
jgi:16S rRNA (guanine527-N7)-methyltransferase